MVELIVNISGLALIFFIIVWFWLTKPKSQTAVQDELIEIIVDNGVYSPSIINMKVGKTVTLRFLRKDPSPCAQAVIFSDFNISTELEVDIPTDIRITPDNPGEYAFACEMAMYKGKLVVTSGCH